MRLKSLLSGTAAAMVALTASQLVLPSPAAATGGHFARLSNKYPDTVKWCVEARDKNNKQISIGCDLVPVRSVGTFKWPAQTDHLAASLERGSGLGEVVWHNEYLAANRDWCYRYTISGTMHEALDKPCKE
ncbi:hypothetical protein [Amycolatopsis sp. NPDC059657]|uniref:hypothetical protein n=1 Tax=Amycolatopsis sp. NPDC059657 TaxID=3346899 RepID=UPI00366E6283